jgi:hypothetical protein
VRFAEPQRLGGAPHAVSQLKPERGEERQNLGEFPSSSKLGESGRGFRSIRASAFDTECVGVRSLARLVRLQKRIISVVVLRGDRGEVVHENTCRFPPEKGTIASRIESREP